MRNRLSRVDRVAIAGLVLRLATLVLTRNAEVVLIDPRRNIGYLCS